MGSTRTSGSEKIEVHVNGSENFRTGNLRGGENREKQSFTQIYDNQVKV